MGGPWRGVIEGFYGRPWTWDERETVMAWCHDRAMTHYVYAPKDDPLHRQRWREPYPDTELDGFARLVDADTLQVAYAVSPGLSIDADSPDDRAALAAKIDQVLETGVAEVVLALDDIPAPPGQGTSHGELTAWLADHLAGRAGLAVIPTDYPSCTPTAYLRKFASVCPTDVPIGWTGPLVVNDEITVRDAERRAEALGGRPPLVWDNYPVNDLLMRDHLFLGPLRGREPALLEVTAGWLATPMVQPHASLLPLASVAAFVRGDDPLLAWEEEADRLDVRPFAEACDGDRPLVLVEGIASALWGDADVDASLRSMRGWLQALITWLDDTPIDWIDREAADWVEQSRTEAEICLEAVGMIELVTGSGERSTHGPDAAAASAAALRLLVRWRTAQRAEITTFGARLALRHSLSHDDETRWRLHGAALVEGRNATDRLVDVALGLLDH